MRMLLLWIISLPAMASNLLPDLFYSAADSWIRHEKGHTPFENIVHEIFQKHGVREEWLAQRLRSWPGQKLVPIDLTPDLVIEALALQAVKLTVVEPSDDWLKDDIYCYFFVTDGVITTGKVTSIYKGMSAGESFLFNMNDRKLYPIDGTLLKAPQHHLIVDYGIIESDGDDIKELQKITAVIVDIAAAVYASQDPQMAVLAQNLRLEVKALADALLATDNDDELVTSTWNLDQDVLTKLESQTFVDIKRSHHHNDFFDTWKYQLHLRLLK